MNTIKNTLFVSLSLTLSLTFSRNALAEHFIASSENNQVQLVELYSSESCSSCPPADKWVSSLKDKKGLWKSFVPIVFHVDYWNDLGWKDGFSSNLMTRRQQEIAHTWPTSSVYTPAVIVDGKEWKDWSDRQISESSKPSDIKLSVYQTKNGDYQVKVEGLKSDSAEYTLRIAKLGMGLSTDVTSGENSGKHLEHNFVVLSWETKSVSAKNPHISFHLNANSKKTQRQAIAVWIEKHDNPIPIQATGAYL